MFKTNNKPAVLTRFDQYSTQYEKSGIHKEYCKLQRTWNEKIITETLEYAPSNKNALLSIGAFIGIPEMALASVYKKVLCVDHENFVPDWAPKNVAVHIADIDSASWTIPEDTYDVCYLVEVIEHLLWSPVPLLKWLRNHVQCLLISTPDDSEWPPMEHHPYNRYGNFKYIPSVSLECHGNPNPMFHCKQYSQEEFVELLTFTGFRLEDFQRIGAGGHQMLAVCTPR